MIRRQAITLTTLLVALVALPAAASARGGDRNHDRIPDRWERANRLSLRVTQARRDPDRDGLSNLREYRGRTNPRRADTDRDGLKDGAELRTGNDPRDRDTDGDGIRDGAENAGTILSFDGTTLTMALATGGKLTGRVTGDTDLQCDSTATDARARAATAVDDTSGDDADPGADDPSDDPADDSAGASGDGPANDSSGDPAGDSGDIGDGASCAADALRKGAAVREASVLLTADGIVFDAVELR